MGKLLNFDGNSDLAGIDPRVVAIVTAAAKASPYDVKVTDGMRVGGKGNHKHGYAMDVQLVDPSTGTALPNKMYYSGTTKVIPGAVEAYGAYEHLAQTARAIQKANYPELNRTFRWGGGFQQGGTPFDLMHFDITPKANGAMAYYNWETGATAAAKAQGLGFTSLGPKATGGPVPPLGLNNEVFPVTASRQIDQQRMQFDARLQNTPLPRPRPSTPVPAGLGPPTQTIDPAMRNAMSAVPAAPPRLGTTVAGRPDAPFRDTGLPAAPAAPQPATMSPALAAARQRLTAAREAKAGGTTADATRAVTPRLVMNGDQPVGRLDATAVANLQPEATGIYAAGRGSLLTDPMSPATPNPSNKPPVAGLRLPTLPTMVAGRPDAPVGGLPAAQAQAPIPLPRPSFAPATPQGKPGTGIKAPVSSASGTAAGRPGGATSVPGNSGKVDNGSQANAAATPQTRDQEVVRLPNGKEVVRGQSYIIGDRLMIADVDEKGQGVLRDVKDTLPFGVSMLGEQSIGGVAARAIAMPMIKQGLADAGSAAMGGINKAGSDVVKTVGSLATQARDTVGSMFGGGAAKPANTLAALGAGPGAGPSSPARPAPARPNTLVQTTVANPAYAEWVKKYGDGSQVQTAPTGGMITANQLAAIQNVNGAVQKPIAPPPPPAPPKTITISKPGNNTLSAPVPAPREARPANTIVAIGGYLYDSSQKTANGGLLKVGKVSSSGNTLAPAVRSSTSTTPSGSSAGRGITGNKAFADWAFG